ncbi:hypothetical protein [Hyalangium gracile]|uniref:hypothetical protein n=1 Tax=Hyalangium gracile TaxID=394092 RepID=UPI001CCEDBA1|nr:hypothetical protein [Hyalangium gracile]
MRALASVHQAPHTHAPERAVLLILAPIAVTVSLIAGVALARSSSRRVAPMASYSLEPEPSELPPQDGGQGGGLEQLAEDFLGGDNLQLIEDGKKALEVTEVLVRDVLGQGQGRANVAVVLGPGAILPATLDRATREALEALGIQDPELQKTAGQIAAAGFLTLGGTLGAAPLVAQLKLLDAGLGLISKDAQRAVHDLLRQFDPTNPSALAGKLLNDALGMIGFGGRELPDYKLAELATPEEARTLSPRTLAVVISERAAGRLVPFNFSNPDWDRGVTRSEPAGILLDKSPADVRPGDVLSWGEDKRVVQRVTGSTLGGVEVFLDGPPLNPAVAGFPRGTTLTPYEQTLGAYLSQEEARTLDPRTQATLIAERQAGKVVPLNYSDPTWSRGVTRDGAPAVLLPVRPSSLEPGMGVLLPSGARQVLRVVGTSLGEDTAEVSLSGNLLEPERDGFPYGLQLVSAEAFQASGAGSQRLADVLTPEEARTLPPRTLALLVAERQAGKLVPLNYSDDTWERGVSRGESPAALLPVSPRGVARGMVAEFPSGPRVVLSVVGTSLGPATSEVKLSGPPMDPARDGFPRGALLRFS